MELKLPNLGNLFFRTARQDFVQVVEHGPVQEEILDRLTGDKTRQLVDGFHPAERSNNQSSYYYDSSSVPPHHIVDSAVTMPSTLVGLVDGAIERARNFGNRVRDLVDQKFEAHNAKLVELDKRFSREYPEVYFRNWRNRRVAFEEAQFLELRKKAAGRVMPSADALSESIGVGQSAQNFAGAFNDFLKGYIFKPPSDTFKIPQLEVPDIEGIGKVSKKLGQETFGFFKELGLYGRIKAAGVIEPKVRPIKGFHDGNTQPMRHLSFYFEDTEGIPALPAKSSGNKGISVSKPVESALNGENVSRERQAPDAEAVDAAIQKIQRRGLLTPVKGKLVPVLTGKDVLQALLEARISSPDASLSADGLKKMAADDPGIAEAIRGMAANDPRIAWAIIDHSQELRPTADSRAAQRFVKKLQNIAETPLAPAAAAEQPEKAFRANLSATRPSPLEQRTDAIPKQYLFQEDIRTPIIQAGDLAHQPTKPISELTNNSEKIGTPHDLGISSDKTDIHTEPLENIPKRLTPYSNYRPSYEEELERMGGRGWWEAPVEQARESRPLISGIPLEKMKPNPAYEEAMAAMDTDDYKNSDFWRIGPDTDSLNKATLEEAINGVESLPQTDQTGIVSVDGLIQPAPITQVIPEVELSPYKTQALPAAELESYTARQEILQVIPRAWRIKGKPPTFSRWPGKK